MKEFNYDNWLQKCPGCGKYIQDSLDFPQCSCGGSREREEEDWNEQELYEASITGKAWRY